MVAGRSRSQGVDTRTRILTAAVELFVERGYAGTSVRDISERLGVTKAALYYHFSSKEMILDALISPFESGFAQLVELARCDPPPPPQTILTALVRLLAETGVVLCAFANDPSVLHHRIGKDDILSQQEAIIGALAGPRPTPARLLRARCAVGCVQSGVMGSAMQQLRSRGGVAGDGPAPDPVAAAGNGPAATDSTSSAADGAAGASVRGVGTTPSGPAGPGAHGGPAGWAVEKGGTRPVAGATTTGVGSPTGIRVLTGFTGDGGADGLAAAVTRVGALSPFAPLLPEELQRLIVEAALAALGPEQSADPSAGRRP
ncbi:TetR/AcrR family transcriptional regulator [Parafrankia sp. FMc2]|uniref:TetR/AcrR family transcriptional regulator n=1 Tax=Parafrankia sp. FMc2 TaxID=3233196 RepID=UPI0034D5F76B